MKITTILLDHTTHLQSWWCSNKRYHLSSTVLIFPTSCLSDCCIIFCPVKFLLLHYPNVYRQYFGANFLSVSPCFFLKIVPFELYFPFQTLNSCPRVDSHPLPFFLLLSELSPDVVKKLKAEQWQIPRKWRKLYILLTYCQNTSCLFSLFKNQVCNSHIPEVLL